MWIWLVLGGLSLLALSGEGGESKPAEEGALPPEEKAKRQIRLNVVSKKLCLTKLQNLLKPAPGTITLSEDLIKTFSGGNPNDYPSPYSWQDTQVIADDILKLAQKSVVVEEGLFGETLESKWAPFYKFRVQVYQRIKSSNMRPADKVLATIWKVIVPLIGEGVLWTWYHQGSAQQSASSTKTKQLATYLSWVGLFFVGPETATVPSALTATSPWQHAVPQFTGLDGSGPVSALPVRRTKDVAQQRKSLEALMMVTADYECQTFGECNRLDWASSKINTVNVTYPAFGDDDRGQEGNIYTIQNFIRLGISRVAEYITAPDIEAMWKQFAIRIVVVVIVSVVGAVAPYVAAAVTAVAKAAGAYAAAATGIAASKVSASVSAALQTAIGAGVIALFEEAGLTPDHWKDESDKVLQQLEKAQQDADKQAREEESRLRSHT